MTTRPKIVGVEWVAELLGLSPSTVQQNASRKPESLPPRLLIPGMAKLCWVEEDALNWINSLRPKAKTKVGRPATKGECDGQYD